MLFCSRNMRFLKKKMMADFIFWRLCRLTKYKTTSIGKCPKQDEHLRPLHKLGHDPAKAWEVCCYAPVKMLCHASTR